MESLRGYTLPLPFLLSDVNFPDPADVPRLHAFINLLEESGLHTEKVEGLKC